MGFEGNHMSQPGTGNEHPANNLVIPEEKVANLVQETRNMNNLEIGEIEKRLADEKMSKKYEEELGNIESGAEFDEMWLATYHDALSGWKEDLVTMPFSRRNEVVLDEVTGRIARILWALEAREEWLAGHGDSVLH